MRNSPVDTLTKVLTKAKVDAMYFRRSREAVLACGLILTARKDVTAAMLSKVKFTHGVGSGLGQILLFDGEVMNGREARENLARVLASVNLMADSALLHTFAEEVYKRLEKELCR